MKDNLNPDFKTFFTVDYNFEKMQKLRFLVLDQDITEAEEIGYFETTMGNVMGSKNQSQIGELKYDKSNSKRGQIVVRGEAVNESNHTVVFQIAANGIQNKTGGCLGMCGTVAPVCYEVMREIGGHGSGHFATQFTSAAAVGTNNPTWQPQKMRLTKFSNGDASVRVKFRLMCGGIEVGHIITTANGLIEKRNYDVEKSNGRGTGQIEFKDF